MSHRYPAEVIAHCVWLYFRFPLSYRKRFVTRGPLALSLVADGVVPSQSALGEPKLSRASIPVSHLNT